MEFDRGTGMKVRLAVFTLITTLTACGGHSAKDNTATPLTLRGDDVQRVLTGNTLVGYDDAGPFWMYYPSLGTIWGQASNGDVDVGRWRVNGDYYCRTWRRWRGGEEQCWRFATDGSSRLIW